MKEKSEKTFQHLRRRVAGNLFRLRAARGLTQMELADAAGLHWRHVQKIEAGKNNVTLITLARLADGLQVDAMELMAAATTKRSR